MIWNLSSLVEIQTNLDQKIFNKFKTSYSKTTSKRRLALIVELSELANEIRFFKFWSQKPKSDLKIILDELADVLHFALTFVIQYKVKPIYNISKSKKKISDKELTLHFIKLINLVLKIKDKNSINSFVKELLKLATNLEFSKKAIFDAYLFKNKINLQRNKSNY